MLWVSALGLVFLLLLTLAPVISSSQTDPLKVLESRHTPGFPKVLNITDIGNLLSVSSPEIRRVFEKLLECNTLECIEGDELSARILKAILYNSTGFDLIGLSNLSDRELLNMINDPNVVELIEALNKKSFINPSDVDKLISTLENARSEGSISPQAYMAALELLKRILEKRGNSQSSTIERKQIEAIRDALIEASRKGLLLELIEKLGKLYGESQRWSQSFNSQRGSLEIRRPQVKFELPSMSFDIVILILLASLATIALLNAKKLETLLNNATKRSGGLEEFSNEHLILKLYWNSVRIIEKVSGIRMDISTTHREYLAKVKDYIGALVKPFKGLTLSYELYRYAGISGEVVVEEALKYYNDLERLRRLKNS